MQIIYSSQAVDFLKKCQRDLRTRILKKIKFYADSADPLEFAERLLDDKDAPYRFGIGDFRAKFAVEGGKIAIKKIGRRDKIYQG